MTYAGLRKQAADTVAALNDLGIGRNDRVAIVLPNGPQMASAFVCVACGATTAPLNPAYTQDEYDFYLSDLGAKALLVEEGSESPAIIAARSRGIRVLELCTQAGDAVGRFTIRPTDDETSTPSAKEGMASADDVALILHTSGTTSRPKIVPLSQANVCASAGNIQETLSLESADVCLNVMPLFHIHGLMAAVLATLGKGASVFAAPGFDALKFFSWLDQAKPTWYTAVPTMHQAILTRAKRNQDIVDGARLRFIRSSSSSLPPQVLAELEDTFGVPVVEAYAMTEASHQMTCNQLPPGKRKPGTVGCAAGPEVAIMSETSSELLAQGETGEVVISWRQCDERLRKQSVSKRGMFRRWLVPDRRSGRHGRGRLSDDHRPPQGDHQSRRRKDFPARSRRRVDGSRGRAAVRYLCDATQVAR